MNKKYFFFDIDGTLTDIRNGEFVKSGLDTIKKLEANGHFVAIATGRAYYKTVKVMDTIGVHNYVCNGGAALVLNDNLIKNSPLDKEKILKIIHEADELGYGILVAFDDSTKVLMRDHRFLDQVGQRQELTEYVYNPDISYDDIPDIYKVYIAVPEDKENTIADKDLLGHIRMNTPYFWYQHDEKDQGIKDMVEYLHGDLKNVVVFGDGENDMAMFKKEWTSIAMGNGYPDLLKMATYVTEPSFEDGIEKACRHFGWIE